MKASSSASVTVALITAFASLAVASVTALLGGLYKQRNDEKLEELKSRLVAQQKERDAELDYRYDAIKQLYTDLQPLFFQLSELCESAYLHTRGISRAARQGRLGAGPQSWWRGDYYLRSTV